MYPRAWSLRWASWTPAPQSPTRGFARSPTAGGGRWAFAATLPGSTGWPSPSSAWPNPPGAPASRAPWPRRRWRRLPPRSSASATPGTTPGPGRCGLRSRAVRPSPTPGDCAGVLRIALTPGDSL
ncbi:hypothetical protein [Meiothermus phage MMP17]|nr:hypothetical protein [Meiothermus phage MMP17]